MNQHVSRWAPLALCIVGSIIVLAVPHNGHDVIVRTTAFALLMAPMPVWTLIRVAGVAQNWLERAVAAVIASMAIVAGVGFFTTAWVGHAWTLHVVLAVFVGVTLVTSLMGSTTDSDPVPIGALFLAAALSIAVAGSAIAVHLAAPHVPVESAFSLQVTKATLTPTSINITVSVSEVGASGPSTLTLSADGHTIDSVDVSRESPLAVLRGVASPASGDLCNDLITISAPDGSYLSPALSCHTPSGSSG